MFRVVICIFFVFYLYVSGSGSIISVGEERAYLSAVFTCNHVVSVGRGFLFIWVLGIGYVILLWHSLSLPYDYFERNIRPTDPNFLTLLVC